MASGSKSVLMAIANKDSPERTWHTVQHEGFHQFAAQVITKNLPIWVNEGMAEYFGEGLWTGDGMVLGVIPPGRLRMVRDLIASKKLMDFDKMVALSHAEWNGALRDENYTQAWSMVHFLAHAEGGKYQKVFVDFINDLGGGGQVKACWVKRFGRDQDAFEKKYTEWWMGLGDNPTAALYAQATVEAMTSYLARGCFLKQKYANVEEFFAACKDGKLALDTRKHGRIWLPKTLLGAELPKAEKLKTWSLEFPAKNGPPKLKLTLDDGTVYTGSFTIREQDAGKPKAEVAKPKPASSPASVPAGAKQGAQVEDSPWRILLEEQVLRAEPAGRQAQRAQDCLRFLGRDARETIRPYQVIRGL